MASGLVVCGLESLVSFDHRPWAPDYQTKRHQTGRRPRADLPTFNFLLHFPSMPKRTSHRWAVDGIEEGMARIEEDGERMITVPLYLLPAGVREGQVLQVTWAAGREKGTLVVTVTSDDEATADSLAKSKATMARAMSQSKKRDAGGDVAL